MSTNYDERDGEDLAGKSVAAAAIRQNGVIYTGVHHHQIIHQIVTVTGIKPCTGEQGFIDDKGNFLTREQAAQLALKSGQLKQPRYPNDPNPQLFSEDLWNLPGMNDDPQANKVLIDAKELTELRRDKERLKQQTITVGYIADDLINDFEYLANELLPGLNYDLEVNTPFFHQLNISGQTKGQRLQSAIRAIRERKATRLQPEEKT